jgi:hypothetical protein
VGTLRDPSLIEEAFNERGHSEVGSAFAGAIDDIDNRIYVLTGRKVDLKVLFPLTLAGFGVWQIMKYGLTIEGFLLIWFAIDTFLRLHQHVPSATPA